MLSPIIGLATDMIGLNITILSFGSLFCVVGHAFLAFFPSISPWVGVTFLGISFSMVASSLWPMIPLIVPSSQVGTAFGTIQSIQNLGIGKD